VIVNHPNNSAFRFKQATVKRALSSR